MSKIALDELLHKLEDVRGSKGSYIARCPVCGGEKPSLKIDEAGGRILLHCFAGCDAREICGALGISFEELGGKTREREKKDEIQEIRDELAALAGEVKALRQMIASGAHQEYEEQANNPQDKTPTSDRS